MLRKFFTNFDQFGTPFMFNVSGQDKVYKSSFGGLITSIIYFTSFAYFLYVISLWISGGILPKIQENAQKILSYEVVQLFMSQEISLTINDLLKIEYTSFINSGSNVYFDPFNKTNGLLSASIGYVQNQNFNFNSTIQQYSNPDTCKITSGFSYPVCLKGNNDLFLSYNASDPSQSRDLFLKVSNCQSQDSNCSSRDLQTSFMNQSLLSSKFSFFLQEYDYKSDQFAEFTKDIDQARDSNNINFYYISLQLTDLEVNRGILFPIKKSYKYISSVEFVGQTVSQAFLGHGFDQIQMQFAAIIKLDPLIIKKTITCPQLGEVLAQIGSIYSVLLVLSNLVTYFNQNRLQQEFQTQIIKTYYPSLEDLQITSDWRGNIKQVQNKISKEFYCPLDYKEQLDKLKEKANFKMDFLNTIYEISRLQFLVQSFYPRLQATNIHKIGIPLRLKSNEKYIKNIPIQKGFSLFFRSLVVHGLQDQSNNDQQNDDQQNNDQQNDDISNLQVQDEKVISQAYKYNPSKVYHQGQYNKVQMQFIEDIKPHQTNSIFFSPNPSREMNRIIPQDIKESQIQTPQDEFMGDIQDFHRGYLSAPEINSLSIFKSDIVRLDDSDFILLTKPPPESSKKIQKHLSFTQSSNLKLWNLFYEINSKIS